MATDVTQQGLGRSSRRPADYAGFEHAPPARRGPRGGLAQAAAAESLERSLGWFSIGLGAAAVAAPRLVCWLSGTRSPALMRLVGTRELTAGIGILGGRAHRGCGQGRGDRPHPALISVRLFPPAEIRGRESQLPRSRSRRPPPGPAAAGLASS